MASFMTEEQEIFLEHIQKKGLKRTAQRDLILDIFLLGLLHDPRLGAARYTTSHDNKKYKRYLPHIQHSFSGRFGRKSADLQILSLI